MAKETIADKYSEIFFDSGVRHFFWAFIPEELITCPVAQSTASNQ